MFCKYCGKEVEHDSKFCKYCGNKLNQDKLEDVVIETKHNKNNEIKEFKKDKNNNSRKRKGLIRIVILSMALISLLITSFTGEPTNHECIKTIKVDGIEVTYRYEHLLFDSETLVQKRYKGTDSAGNKIDTYVTVYFDGKFEGKIDENYVPTEADKIHEGAYYKQVEVNGTINGYKVNDADEKLLIDSAVYEKYTDMIDEVKGCGLYIKFIDGSHSYTKVVTSRILLLSVIAIYDLIGIGFYIFNSIKDTKIKNGKWGDREINIQHKIGVGILMGTLATLITSIIMFIVGVRWSTFLFVFVLGIMFGIIGSELVKDCKLKTIVRILFIVMVVILSPILFLLLILGML